MRYSYKRRYEWSNDLAYLTGLVASDGCLYNDGRHINITSKDIEIISTFIYILGLNVKIGTKRGSYNNTWAYSLQFGDVALYDFFLNCGITPAKSLTMQALSIPRQYHADFLRGYFDGDGSISSFWDTRWKNSLMYYPTFTSASHTFLDWLKSRNKELINIRGGFIRVGESADSLTYAKADSYEIYRYMYYDENVPRLSRKYDKFINFFHTDPYAKILP